MALTMWTTSATGIDGWWASSGMKVEPVDTSVSRSDPGDDRHQRQGDEGERHAPGGRACVACATVRSLCVWCSWPRPRWSVGRLVGDLEQRETQVADLLDQPVEGRLVADLTAQDRGAVRVRG